MVAPGRPDEERQRHASEQHGGQQKEDPIAPLQCYANGCNSFVRKPVEFRSFAEKVVRLGVYWIAVNDPP